MEAQILKRVTRMDEVQGADDLQSRGRIRGRHLTAAVLSLMAFAIILCSEGTSATGEPTRAQATLVPPYLEVSGDVSPKVIWYRLSDNEPREAVVNISVKGMGTPVITFKPQDTVFIMDSSGSMAFSDPNFYRILATKRYVDNMLPPDRAAVVSFSDTATLVNGNHLSSNYDQIKANLDTLTNPVGLTNLQAGIQMANNELITYGEEGKVWIEILLTDGRPDPPETNVTEETLDEAVAYNITIYTIGLGSEVDESLLKYIAFRTGGKYFKAESPEDLIPIYMAISNQFYNYTAAHNVTVEVNLGRGIEANLTTVTGGELNETSSTPGRFNLSLRDILLGETLNISFRVTSLYPGTLPLFTTGSSIRYEDWKGEAVYLPLPELYIR
ncbi:MAG TPA: VWA domain-containing protein, partial [Euryarchaeota archaeon]|nr:VWA domain-containing protein [Euryarchaeota archaeon]